MNNSKENYVFLTTCSLAKSPLKVIHQFPNKEHEHNRIVVLVINCILLFPTISLNGISVITIGKSSQLKSKVCYFVILLQSIVDLGVGLISLPLFIYCLMSPFQKIRNCTLIFLAFRTSFLPLGLSVSTLSAMTMERYVGVQHPFQYQTKITKKRILIYVCGTGLLLFSLLAYSLRDAKPLFIYLSGSIFVLFVFTGLVYTKIYRVIRKLIRHEKRQICVDGGHQVKRQIIRESRRARSCFLVVISFSFARSCFLVVLLCFFLFLLPFALAPHFFTPDSFGFRVYFNWAFTSIFLNSSINSVIFFWTKTLLRKEALKNLRFLWS